MESIVVWFTNGIGQHVSAEVMVFIISLMPILEVRGGLLAAKLLGLPLLRAIPICVLGNLIPIPFILLLILKILEWMKKIPGLCKFAFWLEKKAMNRSDSLEKGEFIGLLLFVGIPLPGTGAWTGSLLAALMHIDFKKAWLAASIGVFLATILVSILWYGLLGLFF